MSRPNDFKWKPESLLDFLLASNGHDLLLTFFGGERARYQPSEIHVEKKIPDRVFWSGDQLFILELKIQIDSRVFSQLDLERAVGRSHYIDHGPYPTKYFSKAEAALQNVQVIVFSIFHPSDHFENLLLDQGFIVYSLERGVKSKIPLDYSKAPLPLVLADLRAQAKTLNNKDEDLFHQRFQLLVQRKLTKEERLFLHRYPQLLQFLEFPQQLKSELTHLQEASIVTESDLKQILLEKLFLLSPEERLKGLSLEERLKGLSLEERRKLLELLQKEELEES